MEADDVLMGRLRAGDEDALQLLYGKYKSVLYSAARRILGDSATAEEILQDTFFQLWRIAGEFDSAKGSLVGWLLVIIKHRAISRLRMKSVPSCCESLEAVSLPDLGPTVLERQIASQLISSALLGLPKAQQEAITLAYFEGLTSTEIATRIRTPLGTVKARLRSAMRGMQKHLRNPTKLRGGDATLENTLITRELLSRPLRQRSPREESESLSALKHAMRFPERLIDIFLQMALNLCHAGTAGLSFLETSPEGHQIFRWTNLVGKLQACVGGTTPRNFSPCGITLDRNAPQLFAHPARYFHYFNNVDVPIVEGLVIPFDIAEKTKGTVWIVSHEKGAGFDSEDVRIMSTLTEYAGSGLHLIRTLGA